MDVPFSRLLSVLHTLTDEQRHLAIDTIRQGVEADGPVVHLTTGGVASSCGLSGRTAVMRRNVTCPVCLAISKKEEEPDYVHWLDHSFRSFALGIPSCMSERVTTVDLREVTMVPSQVTCPECRAAMDRA